MSENTGYQAATAVIPEFEEALKNVNIEIDARQDADMVNRERKSVYDAMRDVEKVNIRETTDIFAYGAAVQGDLSKFSDTALEKVKMKDLGEAGDMIGQLVLQLKGFSVDEEQKKGIFGFFKKSVDRVTMLKNRYEDASENVDDIVKALTSHKIQLLNDIILLDEL